MRDRIEDYRHAQMPWLYTSAHKKGRSDVPIESFMPTVIPEKKSAPTGSALISKVMGMGAIVVPRSGGKGERTDGDTQHLPQPRTAAIRRD